MSLACACFGLGPGVLGFCWAALSFLSSGHFNLLLFSIFLCSWDPGQCLQTCLQFRLLDPLRPLPTLGPAGSSHPSFRSLFLPSVVSRLHTCPPSSAAPFLKSCCFSSVFRVSRSVRYLVCHFLCTHADIRAVSCASEPRLQGHQLLSQADFRVYLVSATCCALCRCSRAPSHRLTEALCLWTPGVRGGVS